MGSSWLGWRQVRVVSLVRAADDRRHAIDELDLSAEGLLDLRLQRLRVDIGRRPGQQIVIDGTEMALP